MSALKGAALFAAILGTVLFCMWWFPQADCNTARKGLAYIERCEASTDCALSASELDLKAAFVRLKAKSCPRPNPPSNLRAD